MPGDLRAAGMGQPDRGLERDMVGIAIGLYRGEAAIEPEIEIFPRTFRVGKARRAEEVEIDGKVHPWPDGLALLDPVARPKVDIGIVGARGADRCYPGGEIQPGIGIADAEYRISAEHPKMLVQVHQPRKDRLARQIDHLRASRNSDFAVVTDRFDIAVAQDQRAALARRRAGAIDDARMDECDDGGVFADKGAHRFGHERSLGAHRGHGHQDGKECD